jgi:hypothetical protein
MRDHLGGDGAAEQDVRLERLALVGLDAVHDEGLALADAVLLAAQTDDRVVHKRGKSQAGGPRKRSPV